MSSLETERAMEHVLDIIQDLSDEQQADIERMLAEDDLEGAYEMANYYFRLQNKAFVRWMVQHNDVY